MADISADCSPEIDGAFSMNIAGRIALRIREIPRQIALMLENRMIARQAATKARGALSHQRDQWQSFKPR